MQAAELECLLLAVDTYYSIDTYFTSPFLEISSIHTILSCIQVYKPQITDYNIIQKTLQCGMETPYGKRGFVFLHFSLLSY